MKSITISPLQTATAKGSKRLPSSRLHGNSSFPAIRHLLACTPHVFINVISPHHSIYLKRCHFSSALRYEERTADFHTRYNKGWGSTKKCVLAHALWSRTKFKTTKNFSCMFSFICTKICTNENFRYTVWPNLVSKSAFSTVCLFSLWYYLLLKPFTQQEMALGWEVVQTVIVLGTSLSW